MTPYGGPQRPVHGGREGPPSGDVTAARGFMGQAYSPDHQWVGAALIDLPPNRVGQARKRGTTRVVADTKVDILDVYCGQCRRPYDAVNGKPCAAAENRDHLVGGPTGERKKRSEAVGAV